MLFELNGNYANRKGKYTVLGIGREKMQVLYEDGTEAELKMSVQERIWENIKAEIEAETASRARRRSATNAQHFIKSIASIGDAELNPVSIRTLVTPTSSRAPEIKIGDRFIYYACDARAFFAVATITGDPREAKSKEYAELQFNEELIKVYPIDIDAYAISLAQAVWLDSVELESQPKFRDLLNEKEDYLRISEDDFELMAELLTEFVEEIELEDEEEEEEDEDDNDIDEDLDEM
jgi:hypothetical protein